MDKQKTFTEEDKKELLEAFATFVEYADDEAIMVVARVFALESYKAVERLMRELNLEE